jgi:hypothetical protein
MKKTLRDSFLCIGKCILNRFIFYIHFQKQSAAILAKTISNACPAFYIFACKKFKATAEIKGRWLEHISVGARAALPGTDPFGNFEFFRLRNFYMIKVSII